MADGFLFDNKVFASSSGSKRCEKIMKTNYLESTILPKNLYKFYILYCNDLFGTTFTR